MQFHNERQSNELVSIILPVFNPNPTLFRLAVESLLNQNDQHIEIIIVEAPSEFTGRAVVESFTDPRIRYILNPVRTSLKDQLNQAIDASKGEFLARMDADDISAPDRIAKQKKFLKENKEVSLVGSCLEIIDEKGDFLGYRRFPEIHEDIVRGLRIYCTIAHPSVMFRKSDVMEMGCYQDHAPMEDWDLWCRMAVSGKRFYNIQEPLLKYRVHAQAGKVTSFKKTLKTGIELKKRHFKSVPGCWGIQEELRCFLEQCLMFLPPGLVIKLFFVLSLRSSFSKKG